MIVDSKHDLNVYADASPEVAKSGCCGSGNSQKKVVAEVAKSGCCGNGNSQKKAVAADNHAAGFISEAEKVDFNEWAGTWQLQRPLVLRKEIADKDVAGSFKIFAIKSPA
jgi:hypothetical protein